MTTPLAKRAIDEIVENIDIPDSAYETAAKRYKDFGEWVARPEARCSKFSPHVYAQGSFRLGTVVRPFAPKGEYDLDLGCRLRQGVTKATHTQKQLKHLVGADLEDYRVARQIAEKKEEKRRCWRLKYADTLPFHMDAVPSIPESTARRQVIKEAMTRAGTSDDLAASIAGLTGAITDNSLRNYEVITDEWRVSNSEGYALWFQSRMKLAQSLMEQRAALAKVARVDDLPAYQWKTPLQRCVQILKRHRDVMFAGAEASKPISAIITTLAAKAYAGETNVIDALRNVLSKMGSLVSATSPRVANPVNPAEDFADKWADPNLSHLQLEQRFWEWLRRAQSDFGVLETTGDLRVLVEHVGKSFGTGLNANKLAASAGRGASSLLQPAAIPAALSFPPKPLVPSKPAGFA